MLTDVWRGGAVSVLLACAGLLRALTEGLEVQVTSPKNAVVGGQANLSVEFTSSTDPLVNWARGGVIFARWTVGQTDKAAVSSDLEARVHVNTSEASIVILRTTLADAMTYSVLLTALGEPAINKSILLRVYEMISNVAVTVPAAEVKEHDPTATLTCSMTTGTWDVLTWAKDGTPIVSDTHLVVAGDGLTIQGVVRTDAGTYSCFARNPFSNGTAKRQLIVYYGPDIPSVAIAATSDPDPTRYVLRNANVTLTCNTSSEPPAQYLWSLGESGDSGVPSDPVLVLERIQLDQAGRYSCIVSNSKLDVNKRKTLTVTVYDLPPGIPTCSVASTENNTALQFSCAWLGGFPRARVWWDGLSRNVTTTSQLVQIENSPASLDGRNVTCVASQEVETKSCVVTPVSPIVIPSRLVATDTLGDATVTLRCQVTANPSPDCRWYRGRSELASGEQFVISRDQQEMRIRTFSAENSTGDYSCSCRNPLGDNTQTQRLTAPSVSGVVVRRLNGTAAIISWAVRETDVVTAFLVQSQVTTQRSAPSSSSASPRSSSTSSWQTLKVAGMDQRSTTVSQLRGDLGYTFRVVPMTGSERGTPSDSQSVAATVNNTLSAGAIAGIVVGCMVALLLIVLLIVCLMVRKFKKNKKPKEGQRVHNGKSASSGTRPIKLPGPDRPDSSTGQSLSNKTDPSRKVQNNSEAGPQVVANGRQPYILPRPDYLETNTLRSISNKTDQIDEWDRESSARPKSVISPYAFIIRDQGANPQGHPTAIAEQPTDDTIQSPIDSSTPSRQKRHATMV